MKSRHIPFIENSKTNQTNGIFSYIQKQTNEKDLDSKGIVSFETNYKAGADTVPLNLTDKRESWWASANNIDAYLLIDFHGNRVSVSDYIILDRGFDFPRKWKILGLNDKNQWNEISCETTNFASNNSNLYCFRYRSTSLDRYRCIKVIQEQGRSKNGGDNRLVFHEIEFYGVFYSYSYIKGNTCINSITRNSLLRVSLIILLIYE